MQDISKAKTHFLAIILKRKVSESENPRILYSLVDAEVLPLSVLEKKFANTAIANALGPKPMDPLAVLRQNTAERIQAGGLGAVMVMSVEILEGEEGKSPEQAVLDVGLFKAPITAKLLIVIFETSRQPSRFSNPWVCLTSTEMPLLHW